MGERQKWSDWYNFSNLVVVMFGIYWALYGVWWFAITMLLGILGAFFSFHKMVHNSSTNGSETDG